MTFVLQFNAATVAPNAGSDPIPSGIYPVVITATSEKPVASDASQSYYEFEMQITDGEYKGRKVFDRLNCKNKNQQAVDIAYGTLSAICHVTGVMQVGQSSAELHGRPFKVNVVKVPRGDDPNRMTNEVRGYLDMAGNPPGKSGAPASQQAPAGFGATGAPAVAAAPTAPAAPAAAPAPAAFPPEGWLAHPSAPGYFYKGQEVLTEAQLRERFPTSPAPAPATPQAPAAPAAPATGAPAAGVPSWAQ